MRSENSEHQHTPEEERKIREAALDETIDASSPASDPLSSQTLCGEPRVRGNDQSRDPGLECGMQNR